MESIPSVLLEENLREVYHKIGHKPTKKEYEENGGLYATRTYLNRYKSWKQAILAARIPWCIQDINLAEIEQGLGHWVAGFVCGEGSFIVRHYKISGGRNGYSAIFAIRLRDDDIISLKTLCKAMSLDEKFRPTSNPTCVDFTVTHTEEQFHILVPFFDTFPIRGKKANDFLIWKTFVELKHRYMEENKLNTRIPDDTEKQYRGLWLASKEIKVHKAKMDDVITRNKIGHLFS